MPVIFSERVYRAVAKNRPAVLRRLTPAHFETYRTLNEALGWLTPQERCDVVYGDWLESINAQAGEILLRTRKLLIEQGGLAANYLAEFAQNADDAYPHDSGGEVHISAPPGWLQVWNNGRPINGTDLLGLCRFFSNGSKIEATSAEMIGKFGIGFKSCYRIGTEVWVSTWERESSFCFRIPLCKDDRPQSHYRVETFERVRRTLDGIIGSEPRTKQQELGFCTPEFVQAAPDELKAQVDSARQQSPDHGTLFAVRLHPEGEKVLRSRIRDQSEQIFELCPLFVRRLRVTRLEETSLRLVEHREDTAEKVDNVWAERVTLEAKRGSSPKSNARFWRLTEAKPKTQAKDAVWKPWRIALHADNRFQLNLARDEGETTSSSDGSAYAFFPLAITWPFNLHLHLDLPTNLDRSSWNPEEPEAIAKGLAKAAAGLGEWLEKNQAIWNSDWSVSALVRSVPAQSRGQSPGPDYLFYSFLKEEVEERQLLRSLWGEFVPGKTALRVGIRKFRGMNVAWRGLAQGVQNAGERFPWCAEEEGAKWGVASLDAKTFVAAAKSWTTNLAEVSDIEAYGRHMLTVVLSVSCLVKKDWDQLFPLIPVEPNLSFADLLSRRGGASLSPEWHSLFAQLADALDNEEWAGVVYHGTSLAAHFHRFRRALWNPAWAVVPKGVIHRDLPPGKIDEFWNSERDACPAQLRDAVLDALLVWDLGDTLRPLRSVWIFSRNVPSPLRSLFVSASPSRHQVYRDKLQHWELLDAYRDGLEGKLKTDLGASLSAALQTALQQGNLVTWLEEVRKSLRELESVDLRLERIFDHGVRRILTDALSTALRELKGFTLLSRSIEPELRAVLAWLPKYREGAVWLDDSVLLKLREIRMPEVLEDVELLRRTDVPGHRLEIVRGLLEIAHLWPSKNPTAVQLAAIDKLAAELTKMERKGMAVGVSPRATKRLDEFLSAADAEEDPNTHWLRITSGYRDKLLPSHVAQIKSLREVCPTTRELKVNCEPPVPETPMTYPVSAMASDVRDLPPVKQLIESGKILQVCEQRPITLQWWEGDRQVAETNKAKFYFDAETRRLFVTHLAVALEDHQLRSVLHTYLPSANQDPEVRTALEEAEEQRLPLVQVYMRFRDRIRRTLINALVTKMGYSTAHVWRELLQNAENAYASMPDPRPSVCSFEFEADEEVDKTWKVRVQNHGRRFNQPDRDGNTRRDIDRIISLGGDRIQVSEELGRYNLGFKSIFSTTEFVEITSGGYEFQVRDLLLRYPADPREDAEKVHRPTSFTWHCSRGDLDKILGGKSSTGLSRFLSAPYLLFGRYVSHVVLRLKDTKAELEIERVRNGNEETVSVKSSLGGRDRHMVLRDECMLGQPPTRYTFAAAVRLDSAGIPLIAEEEERYFHSTYPTQEKCFVPFIIHADFELAGLNRDQLQQQSRRNLSLILSAVRLVFQQALRDLGRQSTLEKWLGWVQVLAPAALLEGARSNYEDGLGEVERLVGEMKDSLLEIVPHRRSCFPVDSLVVPSSVMRKFAARFGQEFEIDTEDWVDESLTKGIKSLGWEATFSLGEWVSREYQDEKLLRRIHDALQDFADFNQQERFEVTNAREAAGRRLQSTPRRETGWTLDRIAAWWKEEGSAAPYILDGDLFPWVDCPLPRNANTAGARRLHLFQNLSAPGTEQGKETWYRLFTFSCLLATGHRVEVTHRFLTELKKHRFFELTASSDVDFKAATAAIFESLVHREHTNENAAGEDAHFWRHIFYDARKVHHLVYVNDFAQVFLDLCQDERCGEYLPNFLRSGQLPGQRPWQGVLGQSASAPLLFVIRELRRLGLIKHSRADALAFFACKPVRKVAVALRWIDEGNEDYVAFDDLLRISQTIHQRYVENDAARSILLPHFDIPLLALEKTGLLYR